MHLPSFLWLWRIAAWAMGFTVLAFVIQSVLGWQMRSRRLSPAFAPWKKQRSLHVFCGWVMVALVGLLLAIGIVGTLGHFGSLGHSWHLPAGLSVTALVAGSAWSAHQIHPLRPWARPLHLGLNATLLVALVWVTATGWTVVQKYLP
ncbi:MAG: DUF4079 domain-containing protein [Cyanobacteria bacterium J06639_1]